MFIAALLLCLETASELSRILFMLNAILMTYLIIDCCASDNLVWALVYELSVLLIWPPLSLEGRAYRKTYALLALLICSLTGTTFLTITVYSMALDVDRLSWIGSTTNSILFALAVLIKTPTFPFSLWLPEAHVESSWAGSVNLAAFALKFSLFAAAVFLMNHAQLIELFAVSLAMGVIAGVLGVLATSDVKKQIASMSIFHMSLGVALVQLNSAISVTGLNWVWVTHSLIASLAFAMIGSLYASSASRLSRNMLSSSLRQPCIAVTFFLCLTYVVDLPWSASALIEVVLLSIVSSWTSNALWGWALFGSFVGIMHTWARVLNARENKATVIASDMYPTELSWVTVLVTATLLFSLG